MWETAQSAKPVVPILVPLLYFQGLDLVEMVRVALNETRRLAFDNTKSVKAFLRETKSLLLFDGLNEVAGRQRDEVIGAIAKVIREYPEHHYVVTSRSQDELWRKLRSSELIQDAVVVQNISDAQAQGYLKAHLGDKTGRTLFNQADSASMVISSPLAISPTALALARMSKSKLRKAPQRKRSPGRLLRFQGRCGQSPIARRSGWWRRPFKDSKRKPRKTK